MQQYVTELRIGRSVPREPRVSIIMPSFDVTPYISEAIESILAQTFTDYEIIVVNDGTPDSVEFERVLEPYLHQVVYAKHEHRGVAGARNTGLRLARAELIAQLDPDDAWRPNFLEVQLEIMESRPDLDILYANSVIFGGGSDDGMETMERSSSDGPVTICSLVSEKCTVLSSLVGRKETFLRAGCFDETLSASEDFDMWLRILNCGGRIGYHRQVVARYRRRGGSLSADSVLMSESILRVLSKAERTFDLTPHEREILTTSKSKYEAFLNLSIGKKALLEGCTDVALDRLKKANEYYNNRKLSLLICILLVAPKAALRIHLLRERYAFD